MPTNRTRIERAVFFTYELDEELRESDASEEDTNAEYICLVYVMHGSRNNYNYNYASIHKVTD